MSVSPADLRSIPLFAEMTEAHLGELIGALSERRLHSGEVAFRAGKISERFDLLVEGRVSLLDGETEVFVLEPVAPLGELGAVTQTKRSMTAVAKTDATLLGASFDKLMQFFEAHGDVAFPFHHNLLRVVASKVRRDQRRLEEMRNNLISTQKAMKRMREALLESDDTPLHDQLFEELDALIEQNKKGHYVVEPSSALETRVRLDDGSLRKVKAISNERLILNCTQNQLENGDTWTGVLVAPGVELPLSGTVDSATSTEVSVDLDPLIDEYATALERHLTKLQMLDVVL
ncbi:MAG: Crp/Fnr family transcriptional regulator [Polyangiaceae bacterium]